MSDQVRVGVGVFVWKDGKFLMGQRVGEHGTGTWSVPGGYLEFRETWEEGAKREVLEETGLTINNIRFVTATNNIFENEDKHSITLWLDSDWIGGEVTINEPDKFVDMQWRDFQTLPEPLFEPCWQQLRQMKPELFT